MFSRFLPLSLSEILASWLLRLQFHTHTHSYYIFISSADCVKCLVSLPLLLSYILQERERDLSPSYSFSASHPTQPQGTIKCNGAIFKSAINQTMPCSFQAHTHTHVRGERERRWMKSFSFYTQLASLKIDGGKSPSRRCSQSVGGAADDSNFSIMHFMSQYGMNFIII